METERVQLQMRGGCYESFYYLASAENYLSVWQHYPDTLSVQTKIILICPPIGYELTHTHRTLRRLAEKLCQKGFIVYRFDYSGTGDATGAEASPDSMHQWIDDIRNLSASISNHHPGSEQAWVGLRLGATLAVLAAEGSCVKSLVLWEPIVKGRAYIRELEAISRLAALTAEDNQEYLECAGFILSRQAVADIKKINLSEDAVLSNMDQIAIIVREDRVADEKLITHVRAEGVAPSVFTMQGFEEMMATPHNTEVPLRCIETLCDYLKSEVTDKVKCDPPLTSAIHKINHVGISEQGCFIGEKNQMFAVLSTPANGHDALKKAVILVNSGSVHHIGPNAVYSQMSRLLAAEGYLALRLDLENIGESLVMRADEENHPYQSKAIENLNAALLWLNRTYGLKDIIVIGICSGAYNAFQIGLRSEASWLGGIIMINPLTFYWNPTLSLDVPITQQLLLKQGGYRKSMRDMSRWKGLFFDKTKLLNAIKFVFQRFVKLCFDSWRDVAEVFGGVKRPLSRDIEELWEKNLTVEFIFSADDPGLVILNTEARSTVKKGIKTGKNHVEIIKGADHTFSTKASRDRLFQALLQRLKIR